MALHFRALGALFLVLALAHIDLSKCHLVKGLVSCLDCAPPHDFSGVKVAVGCSHGRRVVSAVTDARGYFEVEITQDPSIPAPSSGCLAVLLGGPEQLCSSKKSMVSKIIKAQRSEYYTLSTPLAFLSKCPSNAGRPKESDKTPGIGSSKTVNLPLPIEWGLAPSSYYLPYFPIIGIP